MALNYVESDRKAALLCAEAAEAVGISVWPTSAYLKRPHWFPTLDEVAQALVDCRIYVGLLSHESVADEFFCDRMSLAYISNKKIQPVGLASPSALKTSMQPGLKLIILAINWLRVREPREMTDQFADLARHVVSELDQDQEDFEEDADPDNPHQIASLRQRLLGQMQNEPTFWELYIGSGTTAISSDAFCNIFFDAFGADLDKDFGPERKPWLLSLLRHHLCSPSGEVSKSTYESFVTGQEVPEGAVSSKQLYEHFRDYAVATQAMYNVLDMNSSVRLTVIRNVSRFQTPHMINRLVQMLREDDANVRAVAALALGKSQNKAMARKIIASLMELLDSSLAYDRLVRESVVLALGQLRARVSVQRLCHLWRNDPIRDVREAADLALSKIGGDEVDELRLVTEKMSQEVDFLRRNK